MLFTFTISIEVERTEGKFAARDEISDQLQEALESADLGELEGENGGLYEVTDWSVEEVRQPRVKKVSYRN